MMKRGALLRFDLLLAALAAAISLIGVVLISSATLNSPLEGLSQKQLMVLGIGLLGMVAVGVLNYRILLRFAMPLYVLCVSVLVFLVVFGRSAAGAKSWISFGEFSLQPSEFAKLVLILVLARAFARIEKPVLGLRDMVCPIALAAVPIGLTALQPDLGTALTMIPLLFGIAVVAGLRIRAILALVLIGLILFAFAWMFVLKDYQKERLRSFLNPGDDPRQSGYQIQQSLIAIGSGGLYGKGLYLGSQSQLNFVPAQHTDFIFSVLGEELGFLTVIGVLLLYSALFARAVIPAREVQDVAGIYIIVGVVSYIAFQTVINILMSAGMFPTTGVPLPFLSYGGSSLLTNLLGIGLIISVYAHREQS